MSIIQEALQRRAEEEAARTGAAPPAPVRSARPPESRPPFARARPSNAPGRARWAALLLALFAAAYAGYLWFSSRMPRAARETAASKASPEDSASMEAETGPAASAPLPSDPSTAATAPPGQPAPPPDEIAVTAPAEPDDGGASPATDAGPPEAALPPSPAEPWPVLDVQGIILRRPPYPSTALINGRRLRVGESIEGVRLLAVEEESVRLEYRGEQRVLRIGESWE